MYADCTKLRSQVENSSFRRYSKPNVQCLFPAMKETVVVQCKILFLYLLGGTEENLNVKQEC
jgi:hypothetical protein